MADRLNSGEVTGPPPVPIWRRWWVQVLAVVIAARAVTTGILLFFAANQRENAWTGAAPSYPEFATIWDGHWYRIIAGWGYPTELPITDGGHVGENAWAFMPVFPMAVRALMAVTGLDFAIVAVAVSVICSTVAALLFFRLMVQFLPHGSALFAVALFLTNPVAPILQLGYAEAMHAMLLTWALLLLTRRSYWAMAPIVVIMALTRPSGLAFALAMGLHVVHRWWTRKADPFPRHEAIASIAVTGIAGIAGFAWLLIAAAVTGSLTAYTDTELAWRSAYIGYGPLVPFAGSFQGAVWWAERAGAPAGVGIVLLAVLIVAMGAAVFSPWMRRLGVDIRFWVASWLLYLLAVFFPQSSTWRLLLPAFPALGALAVPKSPVFRVVLIAVFLVGQWWWIDGMWAVSETDWTPP